MSTTRQTPTTDTTTPRAPPEETIRSDLHKSHKILAKREPLDPSYKFLLLKNAHVKPPQLHKDKLYKRFGADLRNRVERYMGRYGAEGITEGDGRARTMGRHRTQMKEANMRAAFTLRECKEFEQKAFISAALAAEDSQRLLGKLENEGTRKRKMHAMALGLQERERKKKYREQNRKLLMAAKQKILAAEQATLKKQKALSSNLTDTEASALDEQLRLKEKEQLDAKDRQIEETERVRTIALAAKREREREKERLLSEEREREAYMREREEDLRRERSLETPQEALQRLYEPVFNALWDMEFSNLHPPGINPFRIVIDANTCAAMGLHDYCDIIKNPMNLTFIREKVVNKQYITLQEFFEDVELMISNALLYNSDPNNEYHIAANVMKKKYIKLRKHMVEKLHGQR